MSRKAIELMAMMSALVAMGEENMRQKAYNSPRGRHHTSDWNELHQRRESRKAQRQARKKQRG
jgi:hypothetical protein